MKKILSLLLMSVSAVAWSGDGGNRPAPNKKASSATRPSKGIRAIPEFENSTEWAKGYVNRQLARTQVSEKSCVEGLSKVRDISELFEGQVGCYVLAELRTPNGEHITRKFSQSNEVEFNFAVQEEMVLNIVAAPFMPLAHGIEKGKVHKKCQFILAYLNTRGC